VQLLDGNPFSDIKEVSVDEDGQEDKLGTKMENKFMYSALMNQILVIPHKTKALSVKQNLIRIPTLLAGR
jgi:hypothetical protein